MQLEPRTDWLWCLHTPIVQAYAARQRDGFNLIDTTTAGNDTTILGRTQRVPRRSVNRS